jgi:hypothetical protein
MAIDLRIQSLHIEFDNMTEVLIRKVDVLEKRIIMNNDYLNDRRIKINGFELLSLNIGILYNEYKENLGIPKYSVKESNNLSEKTTDEEFIISFYKNTLFKS